MHVARIIFPPSLRKDVLEKIHIVVIKARARQSVWWPGMSKQLEKPVSNGNICC